MCVHKQPPASVPWSDYLDIKSPRNRQYTFLEQALTEVYCSLSQVKVRLPENENVNMGFELSASVSNCNRIFSAEILLTYLIFYIIL